MIFSGALSFTRGRWLEFHSAFILLTRIPLPGVVGDGEVIPQGRALWAYPLVGGFIGAICAGVLMLMRGVGLPVTLAVIFALCAGVLVSGALHEDGLSDFADGLGGGQSAKDKLRIMRDSHQGVYGAIALMLSFAARAAALVALGDAAPVALVATHTLARGALAVPMRQFLPARKDGIASQAGWPSLVVVFSSLVFAAAIAAAVLSAPIAQIALIGAILAVVAIAILAKRQLGGLTGDVLGAAEQSAEVVVLCLLTLTRM